MNYSSGSNFESPGSFSRNGVGIVRQALNPEEVEMLRRFALSQIHGQGDPVQLFPRHVFAEPEFRLIPFRERIVSALRASLGDPLTYIPSMTLHYNQFGHGWHTDSSSEAHQPYLQSSNYRFAKCGVYLQDNTEDWGGGIVVVPGAHTYPIRSPFLVLNRKFKTTMNRLRKTLGAVTVDIRAGDMIFFDSRLPHKSSLPSGIPKPTKESRTQEPIEIPDEHAKLILYWDACNGEMARDFMENSIRRAGKIPGELDGSVAFFSDYIRHRFPDNYPEDFVSAATTHNVEIASLSASECAAHDREFRSRVTSSSDG